MTFYLLQSAAMLLVAYFLGCMVGATIKSLTTAADDADVTDLTSATAASPRIVTPRQSPSASVPPVTPGVSTARTAVPASPRLAPQPGSGVSPEVTAAAAAAAAATLATAAVMRSPASAAPSIAPVSKPAAPATPPALAGDDLKRIKGIGPEIERKLNALGVRRYSEIAVWSASDVARMNREIGQDGRVQHENWIEQAQILARGGETAFSRRVDRREVNTGMVDSWTPTAPNEVARQAAAGPATATPAPAAAPIAAAKPQAVQPPPVVAARPVAAPPPVAASAVAAAAAVAAATVSTSRATTPTAVTPPTAPATPPLASVMPPVPAASVTARPAAIVAPPPAQTVAPPPASVPTTAQPISMRPVPGSGTQRRFVRLAAPEGKPDDLALISGVGDKTADDLNRYGVYHYWQLAAMGPDDIDYMETRLGHKGRMRREEWPEQGRELMAGKPPRARTDRDRAAHEHGPGTAPAHPHGHNHKPPAAQTQPPMTETSIVPASKPLAAAPVAPVADASLAPPQPAKDTLPPAVTTSTMQSVSAQPHVVHRHHAAGIGAAAAAAVAASAGSSRAAITAPPAAAVTAAPAAVAPVQSAPVPAAIEVKAPAPVAVTTAGPAGSITSVTAAQNPVTAAPTVNPGTSDSTVGGWTPRSRPGNVAARTRDDLKRIKGIGVVIEKKLEAMGITSYAQIAGWATSDIDKVSNALDFKGRIEREQWVEQARILDGGGQTDFSRRMDRGDVAGSRS